MNNRYDSRNICMYMLYTGMDYHMQQEPKHCRVCGQWLECENRSKHAAMQPLASPPQLLISAYSTFLYLMYINILCKEPSFDKGDTSQVFYITPFQWQIHTNEECMQGKCTFLKLNNCYDFIMHYAGVCALQQR